MTARPRLEHARAEATRLHAELGTRVPHHIDPVESARWLGIEVARGGLVGATARLYRVGDSAARIRVSDAIVHPGRLRFSIAHEIGHYVLGHVMPSQLDDARTRGDELEREADVFATEHLTPATMVRAHCVLSPIDLSRARVIAETFETSLVAAALRLVELTAEPCAVAYSEGGVVRWTRRSRAFGYRIPDAWRVRVPSASVVPVPSEPRAVAIRSWVPYASNTDAILIEDAAVVPEPGWGGVLSLLWLRPT